MIEKIRRKKPTTIQIKKGIFNNKYLQINNVGGGKDEKKCLPYNSRAVMFMCLHM